MRSTLVADLTLAFAPKEQSRLRRSHDFVLFLVVLRLHNNYRHGLAVASAAIREA